MNNLSFATITELKSLIAQKKISPSELIEFFCRRFEAFDQDLQSAIEVFDQKSIVDRMNGTGSLTGIPGLIKDNICIKDRSLSCASRILNPFVSPYNATVIERLGAQGAPFIGRANMDEFGMGSSSETSAYKKTKNPWNVACVPGGSSGGSTAAVAAGLVPWSLGSETGGSVRQPAAFCGVVGMKPTYGRVSRFGLVAYASSLDQIGVVTRTVRDNAIILSHIAGHDERDSSSRPEGVTDFTQQLSGKIPDGLTIGVVDNAINAEGMDPEIVAAINEMIAVLEKLGARIQRISLPVLSYSAATYFIISRAEAASNLARFDGVRYGYRNKKVSNLNEMYNQTRHDGFGPEVRSRIMIGNYVLSSGHVGEYYDAARRMQQHIRADLKKAFDSVDLLLMPTHPIPAFKFGAFSMNKLQMDLQDYFTCSANLAGIPAISVPCGFTKSNMPIGAQLLGNHCTEALIYQVADAYEQATSWHALRPQGF